MTGHANFHYDESLARIGGANSYKINYWRDPLSGNDRAPPTRLSLLSSARLERATPQAGATNRKGPHHRGPFLFLEINLGFGTGKPDSVCAPCDA